MQKKNYDNISKIFDLDFKFDNVTSVLSETGVVCKVKREIEIFGEKYNPRAENNDLLQKYSKNQCNIFVNFRIFNCKREGMMDFYISLIVTKIEKFNQNTTENLTIKQKEDVFDVSKLYYIQKTYNKMEFYYLVKKNSEILSKCGYPITQFYIFVIKNVNYEIIPEFPIVSLKVSFNESHKKENIEKLKAIENIRKTKYPIINNLPTIKCIITRPVAIFGELYDPSKNNELKNKNIIHKNANKNCDIYVNFRIWKSDHKLRVGEYLSLIVSKIKSNESYDEDYDKIDNC